LKTILTVVGARPQFIKAAPVSAVIREFFNEYLVHTGQHYDNNMSDVFFEQLKIPKPDLNLGVGSGSHGEQTARMLSQLEKVINEIRPDLVLIYGDTNSTLAASLAAAKLQVSIAHIEAGLRNFDLRIPEEINRVVADKLSRFLFAPTKTAVRNLQHEGIVDNVYLTGDVMFDALMRGIEISKGNTKILDECSVCPGGYCLTTIHRAENTDNVDNLKNILDALGGFSEQVLFPIHPRTRKVIRNNALELPVNIRLIDPVGYLDFIVLEANAKIIVTDSGGVQREAYCLQKPCITVFPSTSWVETVDDGWNKLVDASPESIIAAYNSDYSTTTYSAHFGDGHAAEAITEILRKVL